MNTLPNMALRRWLMMAVLALAALGSVLYHHYTESPFRLVVLDGQTMGTYYRVQVVTDNPEAVHALKPAMERTLQRINKSLSTWDEDSFISRFNAAAYSDDVRNKREYIAIDEDFSSVMFQSQYIYRASDGAFNPTLAPLITAWGFDRGSDTQKWPTPEEISAALELSDFDSVRLGKESMMGRDKEGVTLNFSGIAKGYAVSWLGKIVLEAGYGNYLVDIGGDMLARGHNLEGQLWRVGIEKPDQDGQVVHTVTELQDEAIATSGDYRNYREKDGKRFSHIIDPRTGYPVTHNVASASVRHKSATRADGFATALLVMGREGLDMCEEQKLACYLIIREKDGFSSLSSTLW